MAYNTVAPIVGGYCMKTIQTQYMHSFYAKGNEEFIDSEEMTQAHKQKGHSNETYKVALPYPEVGVSETNDQYLRLILEDYAGVSSEMTAVNQYDYQRLILDYPTCKEISEAIEEISKVEKLHLEMLGEIVILLGGDSRYWSIQKGNPTYWSPQYISYNKSPRDILLENIRAEEKAIKQYSQHIEKIKDREILQVLKRIVLDEQLHLEIFKDLYTRYFG